MRPFLAYIMPVDSGPVDPGFGVGGPGGPGSPGGPGAPGPVFPSHPIYNPPYPDHSLPPFPAHPIAPGGPGGRPPGIWGPPDMAQGCWGGGMGPGVKPQPPSGGTPSHPIVLPPGTIPGLKPEHPIYIPPSSPGVPTHPIVMPPEGGTEPPEVAANWDARTAWTEQTGWVVVLMPSEQHPGVPTPSTAPPA